MPLRIALGVAMALRYRDWDRPPMKRYEWEDEEIPEDDSHEPWREPDDRWR